MVKAMTGTACVTTDYLATNTQEQGYFDRLSTRSFNNEKALNSGCLLVDISTLGGATLIPVHQIIPYGSFELAIRSLEDNNIFVLLQARQRWVNKNYSPAYIKMGFEFHNITPGKHQTIQSLITSVATQSTLELDCGLMHNEG